MNCCKICNIFCSSKEQYQQHIDGAKHKRKATEFTASCSDVQLSQSDVASNINVGGNQKSPENNVHETKVNFKTYFCEVCDVQCCGYSPYEQHLKGKSHSKKINLQVRVQQSLPFLSSSFAEKPKIKNEIDTLSDSAGSSEKKLKTTHESAGIRNIESMYNFCDICKVPCSGFLQYQQHISGKNHQRQVGINEMQQKNKVNESGCELSPTSSSLTLDFSTVSLSSLKQAGIVDNSINSVEKFVSNVEEKGYESYFCKICETQCSGYFPYDQHLKGEKHRKRKNIYLHQLCKNQNSAISNIDIEMDDSTVISSGSDKSNLSAETLQTAPGTESQACSAQSNKSNGYTNEKKIDELPSSSKSVCKSLDDIISDAFVKNMICSLCSASCNTSLMVQQHIAGEKHKKKVSAWKLRHTSEELKLAAELGSHNCKFENCPFNLIDGNVVSSTRPSSFSSNDMPNNNDTFHIDVKHETDSPFNNQFTEMISFTSESALEQLTNCFKISIIGPNEEICF